MPVASSRRLATAVRVAFVVLLIPLVIALREIPAGGLQAWVRVGALLIATVVMGALIPATRVVERRARELEEFDERVRASEAKFSGILSIAADAIITVDEQQKILHFNHGAEEIFGYATGEVIGQQLEILLPTRFRASHPAHMQAFAKSDSAARRMGERREIFGRRKSGADFPAEASISKLDTASGRLFTVVLRDITDRKRAEQDERFLFDAGAQLAASLEVAAAVQAIADLPIPHLADAVLVDVVAPDETLRRVASTRHVESLDAAVKAIAAVAPTADSPAAVIDVMRRRRAEVVKPVSSEWLEAHEELVTLKPWESLRVGAMAILPLVVADQAIGAVTMLSTRESRTFSADRLTVAERFASLASLALQNARLYSSAQAANRTRDEVLNVVSHDLRNPLSAIAMASRALRHDTPEPRENLLETIEQSTRWMNRLIQDLLDAASIERGQLSLMRQPEAVSPIIEQSLHMFEVEAREQGVRLSSHVGSKLPLVSADRERVVQVLGNLLRNAMKFTPAGGSILLEAEPRDGAVMISVRDTGLGIPPNVQELVFDRYWHHSGATGVKRGTGLGLAIAKGIVEAHGGRIWVESQPASGSTFRFTIPAAADTADAQTERTV